MTTGEDLRKFLKDHLLTEQELADKLGVDVQMLILWENGQPVPADKLEVINKLFKNGDDGKTLGESSSERSDGFICTATTRWTEGLLKSTLGILYKKKVIIYVCLIVICALLVLWTIVFNKNSVFMLMYLVAGAIFILSLLIMKRSVVRQAKNIMKTYPNRISRFFFYDDHLEVHSQSDNSNSSLSLNYHDLRKMIETDQFLILRFNHQTSCVEKNDTQGDFEKAVILLKQHAETYRQSKGGAHHTSTPLPHKRSAAIRWGMIALFILSFFCIPIGEYLEASRYTFSSSSTDYSWMFFLLLPISLANLILGVIYRIRGMKTTKNIVVGIIFTFLLCAFGSFTFLFNPFYSRNMSYVDSIASEVHFTLPDKGTITTENFTQGTQSTATAQGSSGSVYYYDMSNVEFADSKQILAFKEALRNSNHWVTSVSTPLSSIIPPLYTAQTVPFDYFMVYNVDLGTYNTVPNKSGSYHFVYIAYDSSGNKMLIGDYAYSVALQ